jgi:hypothetical protein
MKNPRIRAFYKADPDARDMIYLEPDTGSVYPFFDPVSGFLWKCVNTDGKYRYNWVI